MILSIIPPERLELAAEFFGKSIIYTAILFAGLYFITRILKEGDNNITIYLIRIIAYLIWTCIIALTFGTQYLYMGIALTVLILFLFFYSIPSLKYKIELKLLDRKIKKQKKIFENEKTEIRFSFMIISHENETEIKKSLLNQIEKIREFSNIPYPYFSHQVKFLNGNILTSITYETERKNYFTSIEILTNIIEENPDTMNIEDYKNKFHVEHQPEIDDKQLNNNKL